MTTDLSLEQAPAYDAPEGAFDVNEDWCVLPEGLEHRGNGYFIAREALAARRGGLWEWPLHLAEKSWCRPRLLREAFLVALDRFGIAQDAQLARSFALGFGIRSGVAAGSVPGDAGDAFVRLGDLVQPKVAGKTAGKTAGKAAGDGKRIQGERPATRERGGRRAAA